MRYRINPDDAKATIKAIWRHMDKLDRFDGCAGDITRGWDWPTLYAVRPQRAAMLQACYGVVER